MVTPWHAKCGVASYSEKLSLALSRLGVEVYIVKLHRTGVKDPDYMQFLATRIPEHVDLIHVQHEYGLFSYCEEAFYAAARELGKPIVTTLHGGGGFQQDEEIARYSDVVVVHNRWQASRYGRPCVIIPHGVEPRQPLPKVEARRLLGVKASYVAGCFGFISPYKGLEDILYAASKLRDVEFLIAGGWHLDHETRYMAELKRRSPQNVRWLGYLEEDQLPAFFGACDLIIHASRFVSESGSLLTAIGYGKAVIARDLPPNREKPVLDLFTTAEDLAEKVDYYVRTLDLCEAEQRARSYAEENSWSRVAEKHEKLVYEKLLK